MTSSGKTFISVDRVKMKEDRASGGRQAVLRVQRGEGTTLAKDVEILGPSSVKYSQDSPPGVPNIWVETEAELRLDGETGPAVPPPAPRPAPPKAPPLLSRLLQTTLLEQAMRKIESDLSRDAHRPDLLRRLGDLQRQCGNHSAALDAYERLVAIAPTDAMAHRLIAILKGHAPASAPLPEPFVIENDFLPAARLAELLEFTASQRQAFAETPVLEAGTPTLRPDVRWCTNVWGIERITEWLQPLVESRLEGALRLMGIKAQPLAIRDAKITRYGDGGFFGPHVDRGPGAETRVMGFILYFHFTPKRFAGGGLAIYDRDLHTGQPATTCTTIIPEQNQLVFLGSDAWHEVVPVSCPKDEWDAGRFTYNGWVCRTA